MLCLTLIASFLVISCTLSDVGDFTSGFIIAYSSLAGMALLCGNILIIDYRTCLEPTDIIGASKKPKS